MRRPLAFLLTFVIAYALGLAVCAHGNGTATVARAAQPFGDTCATGQPQHPDLIRDWTIRCINELARLALEARRDADAALAAANQRGVQSEVFVRETMYQTIFGTAAGQDWQHLIIQTAEDDWQSRRRPWAATFTRERACQMVRAGYLAPGKLVCP